MSQCVESRSRTFQVNAALKDKRLVKVLSTGKVAYAAADDEDVVGFTAKETFAADEYTPVDLINAEGTFIAEAGGTVEVGDEIFQAADGRLAATGTIKRGVALSAAATGEWFEFLPERSPVGKPTPSLMNVEITVEASATTDGMEVTMTVVDDDDVAIEAVHALEFYFSEDADGIGLTADSYSGNLTAVSTFGAILTALTAKKHVSLVTNASGVAKLLIVDSANPADQYPCVKHPLTGAVIVGPISDDNWEGA